MSEEPLDWILRLTCTAGHYRIIANENDRMGLLYDPDSEDRHFEAALTIGDYPDLESAKSAAERHRDLVAEHPHDWKEWDWEEGWVEEKDRSETQATGPGAAEPQVTGQAGWEKVLEHPEEFIRYVGGHGFRLSVLDGSMVIEMFLGMWPLGNGADPFRLADEVIRSLANADSPPGDEG